MTATTRTGARGSESHGEWDGRKDDC